MRLSKICDACERHTVERALGRDSCTDCDSVPRMLMYLSYIQAFYTSPGVAQDCKRMSKEEMGTAWKGETSRPLHPRSPAGRRMANTFL